MGPFIVHHIDSLVMTAAGFFAWWFSYRVPAGQRARKLLRIGGPVLTVLGIVFFFTERPPAPTWVRYNTNDGMASAEFPGKPEGRQGAASVNDISVQSTTLAYDVPHTDIALRLSFSPVPTGQPDLTDAERLAATKAFFTQQGFSVVDESLMQLGTASGFSIEMERGGKERVWMRVACEAGKVYRVVASSSGSRRYDEFVKHFIESFRIEGKH